MDCLQNQGGKPSIYSAWEVHTIGDVQKIIPWISVVLYNKQEEHQATIIEMDHELCDLFVTILINPKSNYMYVSSDFVDKCGLNKEVHAESWLVQLAIGSKKGVYNLVRDCVFKLNGMAALAHLNV